MDDKNNKSIEKNYRLTVENKVRQCLRAVRDDHIQNNKFRMGILGSQDIDTIEYLLESILEIAPDDGTKNTNLTIDFDSDG